MIVLETVCVAFAMFSALPVLHVDWNERNMRYAMAAFPLVGAVIGALVVAVLRNGLNLNGINSFWQQVILGVLVLVVVYVDTRKTKKKRSV